jgi:Putative peptidoglycan binding domain
MTKPNDIAWNRYQEFEGPFFRGKAPFDLADVAKAVQLPKGNNRHDARFLAVTTAVESGRYDAINMYDSGIVSVGLIQWIEAKQYSVSNLLGKIVERDPGLLAPLYPALGASRAEFKKNAAGNQRFFFLGAGGEVDNEEKQRRLFFLGSSGRNNEWSDDQKAHAKLWAASLADMLAQPVAQLVQLEHTLPRLVGFCMPGAKRVLFDDDLPNDGYVGAVRAAFVSFAVNKPVVAETQLAIALARSKHPKWSREWSIDVLRQLTFGPKIAIYPTRYNAIRPVLARLYGVDFPVYLEMPPSAEIETSAGDLNSLVEQQRALILLGYDLGSSGADGILGPRTKKAIADFQAVQGLTPDGQMGPNTKAALAEALKKKAPPVA